MPKTPEILYCLVGFDSKILVDHFTQKNHLINKTRNEVFPNLNQVGKYSFLNILKNKIRQ